MSAKSLQRAARILRSAGVSRDRVDDTLAKLVAALVPEPRARRSEAQAPPFIDSRPQRGSKRPTAGTAGRKLETATQHYERGVSLEGSDTAAAREAYTAALALHSGHLEATINLGRLLHINGELAAAESIYREARHSSATLSFNLALLLEDLHRDAEAQQAYRDALAQDPALHEAHYHLGLLHERNERPREALRHLLAFKRGSP